MKIKNHTVEMEMEDTIVTYNISKFKNDRCYSDCVIYLKCIEHNFVRSCAEAIGISNCFESVAKISKK